MKIISRAEWGASPWRTGYTERPLSALNRVLIHYHGGPPRATSGVAVPREIEGIHLANGWSGVGYHFIVSQAGEIFEGRGWDKVGAHCPGHNTDGLGIYIGVGGTQEATPEAKAAARWLYDEACRRTGKSLTKSWHGYDYATACPGPALIEWVKAGMPVKTLTPATPNDNGELTMSDIKTILDRIDDANWLTTRHELTPATAQAIGWGKRKNPTMTGLGILQTTMRVAADASTGVRRAQKDLEKIADDIDKATS